MGPDWRQVRFEPIKLRLLFAGDYYLLTGADGLDEDDAGSAARRGVMVMVMMMMMLTVRWNDTAVFTGDDLSQCGQRQLAGDMAQ